MSGWKHFPMWEPRREGVKQFSERERADLELIIAEQISDLLGRHGYLHTTEIDISGSYEVDEPTTYTEISLNEIPLEDAGELVIDQIPYAADGFWTTEGAHSVCKQDEDDVIQLSLTVWDPVIQMERRIHDEQGEEVDREILQELYEALSIITMLWDAEDTGNIPPLSPHEFPVPVIESDFEALISQLYPEK